MSTPTKTTKKPAVKKPTAKAPTFTLPALRKGEQHAGLVLVDGAWQFLILLPGEVEGVNWSDAKAWAKKQGGELPSRCEQSILFGNLKQEFQPRWYWSSEQYAPSSDYAWAQGFNIGDQGLYRKGNDYRARAVRRLAI